MTNRIFQGALGSRLVQRLRRRYAHDLISLPPGAPSPLTLQACYNELRHTYPLAADALRVLRQLVMERLVVLDCEQQAPLSVVTSGMTWLAEFTLDVALKEAVARVAVRHGLPRRADGAYAARGHSGFDE
jgi:glutamate-ammonia-ligase adenylyltransferase